MTLFYLILLLQCLIQNAHSYCWEPGLNPGFSGAPRIVQLSLTKVKVSWKGVVTNRRCADSFLVKYWQTTSPQNYTMSSPVDTSKDAIDVDVLPKTSYVFQAIAREDKGAVLGVDYNKSNQVQFNGTVDHNNPRCETEMVRITGRNSWEIQNEETNATHAKICLPLLEENVPEVVIEEIENPNQFSGDIQNTLDKLSQQLVSLNNKLTLMATEEKACTVKGMSGNGQERGTCSENQKCQSDGRCKTLCKVNGAQGTGAERGSCEEEFFCQPDGSCMKKSGHLMILGGYTGTNNPILTHTVELIDVSNGTKSSMCEIPPRFPQGIAKGGGGVVNGIPIVCGGYHAPYRRSSNCFKFNMTTYNWESIRAMPSAKSEFSSVVVKNEGRIVGSDEEELLLTIGGTDGSGKDLNTIDVFDGKAWHSNSYELPPVTFGRSCVAKISSYQLLVIAGWQNKTRSSDTWIFDLNNNQWKQGPSLNTPRSSHSCALMVDQCGHSKVVVAGGYGSHSSRLSSVEVIDVDRIELDDWNVGPDLPSRIDNAEMVATDNGRKLLLIGGAEDNSWLSNKYIYQLTNNPLQWSKLPMELTHTRNDHVVINIPNYPQCNN